VEVATNIGQLGETNSARATKGFREYCVLNPAAKSRLRIVMPIEWSFVCRQSP
jgi:hypothetical protein